MVVDDVQGGQLSRQQVEVALEAGGIAVEHGGAHPFRRGRLAGLRRRRFALFALEMLHYGPQRVCALPAGG